jgi:hypothetical protein
LELNYECPELKSMSPDTHWVFWLRDILEFGNPANATTLSDTELDIIAVQFKNATEPKLTDEQLEELTILEGIE